MKKLTFLVSFMCLASMLMAQTTNYDANGLYTGTTVSVSASVPYTANFNGWTAPSPNTVIATLREVNGVAYTYCSLETRTPSGGTGYMALTTKNGSAYIYLPKLSSIGTITIVAGYSSGFKINIQKYNGTAWEDVIVNDASFQLSSTWNTISKALNISGPTQLRYKQGGLTNYIAIRSISVSAVPPVDLVLSKKYMFFDNSSDGVTETFTVSDNQSAVNFTLTAPPGIALSKTTLTPAEAQAGTTITATFDNTVNISAANIVVTNGTRTENILIDATKDNLVGSWDADGSTDATASLPTASGWALNGATGVVVWAPANIGSTVGSIRYADVPAGYTYNTISYKGRVLYLRWDGVYSNSAIYSLPVALTAGKTYSYKAKFAFNGGVSAPVITARINSANNNSGATYGTNSVTTGATGVLTDGSFQFSVPQDGTYYLTFGGSTSTIGAIADLSVTEVSATSNVAMLIEKSNYSLTGTNTVNTLTVKPGFNLTVADGATLNATALTLESNASGTATLLNSGTFTGTVIAKQYLGSARNWYVSSPVSSASAPDTNMDYYYEYMEGGTNTIDIRAGQPGIPTDYWRGLANGTTMEVGKGYIAKTNASATVQFSGTPNNGDITTTFNLTRNDAKGKGFNLVGNPYPSYIDWTKVATANPNLDNTYYYRTKNTNVTDTYTFVTWNGSGSSYVVSNGSLPVNTSITSSIPPTQAFWVRVKSGTATTKMHFNNGMREHRLDNNNLMKARKQDTRTSLRLQLLNGTQSDEILVYLDGEASNNYDAYDSPKMMNNSVSVPDLYSKVGNERLVINGLNSISDNMELALGFSLNAAASLKLKTSEMSNLPNGTRIYLLDKEENTQTELFPGTEYGFNTSAATTNNESRFSLIFRAAGVTTDLNNDKSKSQALVFVNAANQITIIAPEKVSYSIYNTMGQLIESGRITSNNLTSNFKLASGVYVVIVNNQSTRVIIK